MEVQGFVEKPCCNLHIINQQLQVHKIYGLYTGGEFPCEFAKCVDRLFECFTFLIIILPFWYPDTKDIINIPFVEQKVVPEPWDHSGLCVAK